MNHSFNVDFATEFGIEQAIMIEHLAHWIRKNQSSKRHYYDGYFWTYNTGKSFHNLFPYLSPMKIHRLLTKMEEQGIIKSANYNKSGYDRTKWYTLVNESILQFYKIHFAELKNGSCKSEKPIPSINTGENTDNPIIPFQGIIDVYHEVLHELPRVLILSPQRKRRIKALWELYEHHQDISWWREYFEQVAKSDFLCGRTENNGSHAGWTADIDFLINKTNFIKIVEGKYHRGK